MTSTIFPVFRCPPPPHPKSYVICVQRVKMKNGDCCLMGVRSSYIFWSKNLLSFEDKLWWCEVWLQSKRFVFTQDETNWLIIHNVLCWSGCLTNPKIFRHADWLKLFRLPLYRTINYNFIRCQSFRGWCWKKDSVMSEGNILTHSIDISMGFFFLEIWIFTGFGKEQILELCFWYVVTTVN